jgi:transcription elongation factor GreA
VHLLESLGKPVDVAAIKASLEGLVAADKWTGWWNKARSHPRVVTSGSGSRLRYAAGGSVESATDALLDDLTTSDPRKRLSIARRMATRGTEATASTVAVLADSLTDLETLDPGLAWETSTLLGDFEGGGERSAAGKQRLMEGAPPLHLLSGIQDRTVRLQALNAIRTSHGDEWIEVWAEWLLHEQHPVVLAGVAVELVRLGQSDTLDATLEAVFRNHLDHPAQFIWACETMTAADCPEPIRRRITPSLLEKLPDTLTRSEFAPFRGRAKELLDGGQVAVRLIIDRASAQQASRFVSRISRVSSVEPQRMRVLEQAVRQRGDAEHEVETPLFVATREAVDGKRSELRQLVNIEIPRTLKGIQAAAAEGDLRENFEYHMLRDRQELQSAKAAKIQQELAIVQILEPGTADCTAVNIGTVVHFADRAGQPITPITILGSWDADVDRRIFANGSGVAEAMLGKKVGDQANVDETTAVITDIQPWTED